ncbi:MBOAT, membrane-bound O-acyltransferase family-domain-containing protein [Limtongia smithiae]|uniref:MBOAT, membrane-bound O-acyltransferase family-domain-containing protein n=1 Tax=Limtongia smithiae TaxID=1125753 RepID=UPI0034CE4BC3
MLTFIDAALGQVAAQIGLPTDPLKLFLTFVLSYPFCAVLKRLPDSTPVYKQLFCLAVSAFYLLGIFDLRDGLCTLMISSLGTYVLAKFVKSPLMPWLVFLFVMGHLTISHIKRFVDETNPNNVDITGAQMVLVMKLSAFAWNVHDGRRPLAELSPIQQDRALKMLPSMLDFFTYVLFFPSLLVGPSFDYSEFRRWLDLSIFDAEVTAQKIAKPTSWKVNKRRIPRSGRVAGRKALMGVFWIALWVVLSGKFSTEYLLSDAFLGRSFVVRIFYLWILSFVYRLKYYGAWYLSEGACILSGLGYNGIDPLTKKRKWDRVQNIDPYRFETGQNTYTMLETWNMNTNKWLKTYIYLRVTPRGKKPGFRSTLATFLTSALWHGVYPGYYLTFVTGAFMQSCGRYSRRYIRPFFMAADQSVPGPYKRYFDLATYIAMQLTMGYAVQPFVILTFRESMHVWRSVYFYIHIALFVMTALFSSRKVTKIISKALKDRTARSSKLDQLRFEVEQARSKMSQDEIKSATEELPTLQHAPSLGLPDVDVDDTIAMVKQEMEEDLEELRDFRRRATMRLESAKAATAAGTKRPKTGSRKT